MKRILIIGPCGSGKSYYSKKLGQILNINVYHLDNIWWKENKENISKEEFDDKVREILQKEKYIIDGLYTRTLKERANSSDTIIYLDFELDYCIANIKKRAETKREDLPWVESKEDANDLIEWVISTFKEKKKKIEDVLIQCDKQEIIRMKAKEEMEDYLEKLKNVSRETYTEGVIFDFNGTLYYDDDLNDMLWKQTIIDMVGPGYDHECLMNATRAQKNSRLIRNVYKLIGKEINDEEVEKWSKHKEQLYRKACVDLGRNKKPDGAAELLDYLKEHKIPVNLCTNSSIENVQFYFKNVELYKWFDISKVVYDNGEYADKEEMYRVAAKNIGCDISNCVVFEDTKGSIEEAIKAGCKRIFAMQEKDHGNFPEIIQELRDYTDLNYELLGLKK